MLFYTFATFFISISLINAATLDGYCEDNQQCLDNGLVCLDKKCQCDIRWYKPCKSECQLISGVSYEGQTCKDTVNCVPNTLCLNGTCKCASGLAAKNGVCFKPLNTTCQNDSECWSNYCVRSQCQCPQGTNPVDGITCQKKLLNVYENWTQANEKQEFCSDRDSCLDISAICLADPIHPENKFCQCPLGSKIEDKKCVRIKGEHLSPLDNLVNDYGRCGYCEDTNAVCIEAAGQKTCWCRSGYRRNGNECQKYHTEQTLIFPNQGDVTQHNFTSNCSWDITNGLCACPSGYEFTGTDKLCVKYERKWEGDIYEYGLCTQINSNDGAYAQYKLCPEPLTCIPKRDKHVCSCGEDKFRDLTDASQCVYYIGKGATDVNGKCPTNALKNATSGNCECLYGYKSTDSNRRCELKLSSGESDLPACQISTADNSVCTSLFGTKALLCNNGECRCKADESAPNAEGTHCLSKLNTILSAPYAPCPWNASLSGSRCICDAGFDPSVDLLTCVKKNLKLVSHQGDSASSSSIYTTADCTALFPGPVEFYTNDECRCKQDAFLDGEIHRCWFKLNIPLTNPGIGHDCPPNSYLDRGQCNCNTGYRSENNNKCVQLQEFVYDKDDNQARNITDFDSKMCVPLFGYGSEKSPQGDYCICKSAAFPRNDKKYCHFFINVTTSDLKNDLTCPDYSQLSSGGPPHACICKPGYRVSADNRLCERAPIQLIGVAANPKPNEDLCSQASTAHCVNLYGEHAFCQQEQCYCDRRYSFKNSANECEKLYGFVFPGEQQLDVYSCQTKADCVEKNHVVCDYWYGNSQFKVCQCEKGTFLDQKTQTCVDNRCNCDLSANFECRDYECQCKDGYYLKDNRCEQITEKLQLHQTCNASNNANLGSDSPITCDPFCNRAVCQSNYKIKDSTCVPYELSTDMCFGRMDICSVIDSDAVCDRNENKCICKSGYYQLENECATPVGALCSTDNDCDHGMQCKGKICACQNGQHTEEVFDAFGRRFERCLNSTETINGAKQYSHYPILMLLVSLVHIYFY